MAKFKKGDQVRFVGEYSDLRGRTGIVLQDDDDCPYVDWLGLTVGHDAIFRDGRKSVMSCYEREMELDSPTAAPTADRTVAILLAAGHVTQAQVDAALALLAMEA